MSSSMERGLAGADDLVDGGGFDAAFDAAAWLMRAPAMGSADELPPPPTRLSICSLAASPAICPTDLTSPTHRFPPKPSGCSRCPSSHDVTFGFGAVSGLG